MHACAHTHTHTHTHMYTRVRTYTHTPAYMHTHARLRTRTHAWRNLERASSRQGRGWDDCQCRACWICFGWAYAVWVCCPDICLQLIPMSLFLLGCRQLLLKPVCSYLVNEDGHHHMHPEPVPKPACLCFCRKAAITTRILSLVHQLCIKRIHVTKRDLFYTDVKLFEV